MSRGADQAADHVLLLHGQPGNARDWDRVRAAIGDRARVIANDRPGWDGRSQPRDLAGNAAAAVAELDADRIDRATVVGHSLGGAIAAWLAAQYPERVAALVLTAPSANRASLNPLDQMLAAPLVGAVLGAAGLAGIGVALATPPLRRRISEQLEVDAGYLLASAETLLNPAAWRVFAIEQRMLIRELPALEARLSQISAPTTVVIGAADRIVAPASARSLAARIPAARLTVLERATHLLPQQRPDELAQIIINAARRP
jgi:pimeloyl-ACP methyl ester carboxylesterase